MFIAIWLKISFGPEGCKSLALRVVENKGDRQLREN
jgi:hypothetical protein